MTIRTEPLFYYGIQVTDDCKWVDFKEGTSGGDEISFSLDNGDYTSEGMRAALELAFNTEGSLNYTVTFDRFTKRFLIHANDYFELLLGSGTNADKSLLACLGFGSYPTWGEGHLYGAPHLFYGNSDSGPFPMHSAPHAACLVFDPQFCVQDFLDADNNLSLRNATVNESSNGDCIEVIDFGEDRLFEMNFRYITNEEIPCGAPIRNDSNAVASVNSFLKWAIERKEIEFMADKQNPSEYEIIRLTKTATGKTSYRLKELTGEGLAEFFETGRVTFRRQS